MSHKNTPKENNKKVESDKSLVCFVLTTLTSCGRKAAVVRTPAAMPIINIFIYLVNFSF